MNQMLVSKLSEWLDASKATFFGTNQLYTINNVIMIYYDEACLYKAFLHQSSA
jgi:hypothetical protein